MFWKYAKGGVRIPEPEFQPMFTGIPYPALRPCLADGKPALFHRWVDEDKGLLKIHALVRPDHQQAIVHRFHEEGVADSASSIEKLRATFALVEYADGSVGKVKPELIQFLDRKEGFKDGK